MASTRGEPFGRYQTESIKQSEERMTFLDFQLSIIAHQKSEKIASSKLIELPLIIVDNDDKEYSPSTVILRVDENDNPIGLVLPIGKQIID
jgi:hypothetical protein